jgi:hypothetical protein
VESNRYDFKSILSERCDARLFAHC